MVAVRSQQADRFCANPPAAIRMFLVYGVDPGGVTERARTIERVALQRGGGDTVIRFGSDEIAADPARLADEATTSSLFGGEAVIALRILDGRHNVLGPLAGLLAAPPSAAWIVVEAGELKRDSALLRAFDASPAAAAIPTYLIESAELNAMIAASARDAGLTIDPEAAAMLAGALAGNRLAARGELEKLFLYVGEGVSVTLDDVAAIVGDLVESRIDAIVDAAIAGDAEALEAGLDRLRAEGGSAAALLSGALRHLTQLTVLAAAMQAENLSPANAIRNARPPIFSARQSAVQTQLARWPPAALATARRRVAAAILQTRKHPALDLPAASTALHGLAAR